MNKHPFIFVPVSTLLLCITPACQEEDRQDGLSGQIRCLELPVSLEQGFQTRMEISSASGKASWSEGDRIGIWVEDAQGNSTGYHVTEININPETGYSKVTVPLNSDESLTGYAIYPFSAAYGSDAAPTGATPKVVYPSAYDLSEQTSGNATSGTFVPAPMMAVNGGEDLFFYHVGSLVRLRVTGIPSGTKTLSVTFHGIDHVCGICQVSHPGTAAATTEIVTGFGNEITFTGFADTPALDLSIPVPNGDYASLASLRLLARNEENTVTAAVSKAISRAEPNPYGWGILQHAYGRLVPVDFATGGLLANVVLNDRSEVTLWKSNHVVRTATALDGDGDIYSDAELHWSSSDERIATVDPATGVVTGVGAGDAVITVTATPLVGGTPQTDSYTVHVNAVTGVEFSGADSVIARAGGRTVLTATLAHTRFGTIVSYPDDMIESWTSSRTDYVILADEAHKPTRKDDTHGTAIATAVGANLGGPSVITLKLTPRYALNVSQYNYQCTVTSRTTVSCITDTPHTFKGMCFSKGILLETAEGVWTLSTGEDPFELLPYYGQTGDYILQYPRRYFTWPELSIYFDGVDNYSADIQHSLNTVFYNGAEWILPSKTEWLNTIEGSETQGAVIINDLGPQSGLKHFAKVRVDLSGSPYEGITPATGMLLFPDNAVISCAGLLSGLDAVSGGFVNNVTYDEVLVLVEGGCLFLPSSGAFTNGKTWFSIVTNGNANETGAFLASTNCGHVWRDLFEFATNYGPLNYVAHYTYYYPAHLIKKTLP